MSLSSSIAITTSKEIQPSDQTTAENTTHENGEDGEMEEMKRHCCIRNSGRIGLGIFLVICAALVITDTICCRYIGAVLEDFEDFVQDQAVWGSVSIALVYCVCTVLLIPGAALTLAAGAILGKAWGSGWGILIGSLTVLAGAYSGAVIAFLLGKFSCRPCVGSLANRYKYVKVLERIFSDQGSSLKLLVILRLSPIIPFTFSNYIYGALPISFRHYLISLFFILPGTVMYVCVGALATSFSSAEAGRIALFVGVPLLIIAVFFMIRAARRELNKMLAEGEQEESQTRQDGEDEDEEAGSNRAKDEETNAVPEEGRIANGV